MQAAGAMVRQQMQERSKVRTRLVNTKELPRDHIKKDARRAYSKGSIAPSRPKTALEKIQQSIKDKNAMRHIGPRNPIARDPNFLATRKAASKPAPLPLPKLVPPTEIETPSPANVEKSKLVRRPRKPVDPFIRPRR
jgi:hypothetical protein